MIGSALFFLLGFLAALLLALLLAPAYRRRTVSLTRRRIEATVPLTREEILAEKDRMRAEHAMEVRRVEIAAKTLRETNSLQLVELGRAREALAQTSNERLREGRTLADAEARVATLEAALADARMLGAETERGLAAAQAAMDRRGKEIEAQGRRIEEETLTSSNRQAALLAAEAEIERLKGEIGTLAADTALARRSAEEAAAAGSGGLAQELEALGRQLEETSLISSGRQIDLLARETEIEQLRVELAEARRTIMAAEAAAGAARGDLAAEFDALGRQLEETLLVSSARQIELVARETEIDRLNGEIADQRAEMARRLGAADEAVAALRSDRVLPSEIASIGDGGLAASDETGRLQERLTLLMRENRRLKDELAELELERAPAAGAGGGEGDDLLRDRLAAMAAQIVALAASVEGSGSPIDAILAGAPASPAQRISLADRIRALQRKAAASESAEAVQGHGGSGGDVQAVEA